MKLGRRSRQDQLWFTRRRQVRTRRTQQSTPSASARCPKKKVTEDSIDDALDEIWDSNAIISASPGTEPKSESLGGRGGRVPRGRGGKAVAQPQGEEGAEGSITDGSARGQIPVLPSPAASKAATKRARETAASEIARLAVNQAPRSLNSRSTYKTVTAKLLSSLADKVARTLTAPLVELYSADYETDPGSASEGKSGNNSVA